MSGYAGYAIGAVTKVEFKTFTAKKSGKVHNIYEISFKLKEMLDATTNTMVEFNSGFLAEDYNDNTKNTLWLDPVVNEGKEKSSLQVSIEILKDVFGYEVTSKESMMPEALNSALTGKMAKLKCKIGDDSKYTECEGMYNIDSRPTKKVTEEEAGSLDTLLDNFFSSKAL